MHRLTPTCTRVHLQVHSIRGRFNERPSRRDGIEILLYASMHVFQLRFVYASMHVFQVRVPSEIWHRELVCMYVCRNLFDARLLRCATCTDAQSMYVHMCACIFQQSCFWKQMAESSCEHVKAWQSRLVDVDVCVEACTINDTVVGLFA